nr:MAG TPA: hypothetical protein [Caudoviricetes sp.]
MKAPLIHPFKSIVFILYKESRRDEFYVIKGD